MLTKAFALSLRRLIQSLLSTRTRKKGNVFFYTTDNTFIINAKEIPTFRRESFIPPRKLIKVLKGVVASRGQAEGLVRM